MTESMRLLLTLPHDTLLRREGHLVRLRAVLDLLAEMEVGFVLPDSTPVEEMGQLGTSLLFPFREPSLFGRRVPYGVGLAPSFRRACRDAIKVVRPHLLVCDFPWGGAALAQQSSVPMIYLSHGVERDFVATTLLHLGIENRAAHLMLQSAIAAIERRTIEQAQLVLTMSALDSARYAGCYGVPAEKLFDLPQPVWLAPTPVDRAERRAAMRRSLGIGEGDRVLVLHGSWHHVPNRRAFAALREHVLPALQARFPALRLLLAGSGVPEERGEAVTAVGFVEDLDALLVAADLAVMPIRDGAGVRMKTFDYVRNDIPIVGTKKALEGIAFEDGVHAAISDDSTEAFIERVGQILSAPDAGREMAVRARRSVEQHHHPEILRDRLNSRVRELISPESTGKTAHAVLGGTR